MRSHFRNSTFTVKEVLKIFVEHHRLSSPLDFNADPTIDLTEETTVDEWRSALDLLGWRQLGKTLNEEFDIRVSKAEWKEVLVPARSKKLIGVCALISNRAIKREPVEVRLFGKLCKTAGLFLFIKDELERKGVNTKDFTPSSLLKDYLSSHYAEMMSVIARLEGNCIERFELRRSQNKRTFWQKLNVFRNNTIVEPIGVITVRDYLRKMS